MSDRTERAARLERWWRAHREAWLRTAIALMTIAAGVWLAYEFWRLLLQAPPWGGIDLRYRHSAVQQWIAGVPIYERGEHIDPPATQLLLWPLIGWTSVAAARWIWAVTSAAALAWTSVLLVRHSGASTPLERRFVALMPFSIYASGATIGNGQLAVHLLPLLIAACAPADQPSASAFGNVVRGAMFLGALVKPNLSAAFFWILLFVPASLAAPAVAAGGYVALTVLAAWFQHDGVFALLGQAAAQGSAMGTRMVPGNVANLHVWLGMLGHGAYVLPATLVVLIVLGLWVFLHRRVDQWILLGVSAFATLFASYHRWYDEVLLLLPMVALFRLAKGGGTPADRAGGGLLLALMLLSTMAPGGLFLFPYPLNLAYVAAQLVVWAAAMAFLIRQAWRARAAILVGRPAPPAATT